MPRSSFGRAIIFILLAILLFDIQGAIIKVIGDRYSVPQIATFRNLIGLLPSFIVLYWSKEWQAGNRTLYIRQWPLAMSRGISIAVAQYCFYLALTKMEFATAATLAFAGPLFITALSVPILKSQVGLVRWLAVGIGFAGIVLVMRPRGDVFQWVSLLPVGAALGYAFSSVLVRLFDRSAPTATINLYTTVGALICSSTMMFATHGYVEVASGGDWMWMIAMGLVGGTAVFSMIAAYRLTQPSNLSPFEYFGIPFSFTIGLVFFGEAPFEKLFPGVILIVAGGLLIVWRERRRATTGIPKAII